MLLKGVTLFLHRKILLSCFVFALLYFSSTFLMVRLNPPLTAFEGMSTFTSVIKRFGEDRLKTTTTPTPLNILTNTVMNKKNITVEKYDAMKVYTDIMKRRIARLTGKFPHVTTTVASLTLQESKTNESVHIFYSDILNKPLIKGNKNASIHFDIIRENIKIAKKSGAGVILLTCARISNSLNAQTSIIHHNLKLLFQEAPIYNMKISIAIKDYVKRNVMSIRRDIKIFLSNYGKEKYLYKFQKDDRSTLLPVIYILGSYTIPSEEWSEVLSAKGKFTMRQTKMDAIMLGEFRNEEHSSHIRLSQFDGFFTSYLMNKDSFSSTWKNWQSISTWANDRGLLWSAGIAEVPAGLPAVGVALRTALRCVPRPTFVSLANVPPTDEYLSLTQNWLIKWSNNSITDI